MNDSEEFELFQFPTVRANALSVAIAAAIARGVQREMSKLGYETFIHPGMKVTARKRWPANDLPIVDAWFEPMALQDVDERHAAWKDSEGYWWPAWYLPRGEATDAESGREE